MNRRIRKVEFESIILFQKDGWCLGPWHGWKPEFTREVFGPKGGSASYNRLQVGPVLITLSIYR